MEQERNIWVIGGDLRQVRLAQLLAQDGHTVYTFALDAVGEDVDGLIPRPSMEGAERADWIILPLTTTNGKGLLNAPLSCGSYTLSSILRSLHPSQFLCGGRVGEDAQTAAAEFGLTIHDYFTREELAVANAVPTAEGAIQLAMEHLPITVHGSRVLVLGFGRVGRITAQRFSALGARVTAAARRHEQLAWAAAMGLGAQPLEGLAGWLCAYDLVINTVPAQVLGRRELEDLRPDCLILELASAPGGIDLTAARELGRTVIPAPSLPGKVAPVTAGAAIKNTIYHMLRELG